MTAVIVLQLIEAVVPQLLIAAARIFWTGIKPNKYKNFKHYTNNSRLGRDYGTHCKKLLWFFKKITTLFQSSSSL